MNFFYVLGAGAAACVLVYLLISLLYAEEV